jgi:hypothetical protein
MSLCDWQLCGALVTCVSGTNTCRPKFSLGYHMIYGPMKTSVQESPTLTPFCFQWTPLELAQFSARATGRGLKQMKFFNCGRSWRCRAHPTTTSSRDPMGCVSLEPDRRPSAIFDEIMNQNSNRSLLRFPVQSLRVIRE